MKFQKIVVFYILILKCYSYESWYGVLSDFLKLNQHIKNIVIHSNLNESSKFWHDIFKFSYNLGYVNWSPDIVQNAYIIFSEPAE